MFRLSKLLFILLLLIMCSCSSEEQADEDLFLGSDGSGAGTVEVGYLKVVPLKGGDIDYKFFQHFFDIQNQQDIKTAGCEIANSQQSHSKKTCVIEVNELDLYVHGLELEINTPPGMCKYLALDNYWYYNYEVGRGYAETIKVDPKAGTCKIGNPEKDCSPDDEILFDGSTVSCLYDHTNIGGPNCCIGQYSLITIYTDDDDKKENGEPESLEWGGNYSDCISGPGTTEGWEQVEVGGFTKPARIITDVRLGGLKTKITIPKPIDQDSLGNIFAANFYTGALSTAPLTEIRNTDSQATAENPHLHTRGSTDRGGNAIYITSKIPKIINPIADRSGSQINISGNDAYRVLCLDEAHEVLQQINVYIREWNTLDKYDEYVGNVNNTSPEPDVGGTEADSAADCLPFRNNRCNNDYPDLDDFPGVYPNR